MTQLNMPIVIVADCFFLKLLIYLIFLLGGVDSINANHAMYYYVSYILKLAC